MIKAIKDQLLRDKKYYENEFLTLDEIELTSGYRIQFGYLKDKQFFLINPFIYPIESEEFDNINTLITAISCIYDNVLQAIEIINQYGGYSASDAGFVYNKQKEQWFFDIANYSFFKLSKSDGINFFYKFFQNFSKFYDKESEKYNEVLNSEEFKREFNVLEAEYKIKN